MADVARRQLDSTSRLGDAEAAAVADVCTSLGHPTRVTILATLDAGKTSPSRVARALGQSNAAISHHFDVLHRARLVRPAGTQATRGTIEHFYALTAKGEALVPLFAQLADAVARPPRRRRLHAGSGLRGASAPAAHRQR